MKATLRSMLSARSAGDRTPGGPSTRVAACEIAALGIGLLLATAMLAACGSDDAVVRTVPEEERYPLATTEHEMVINLLNSYNERYALEYETLLHDDFVFFFAPDEIDELGEGATWSRARDVASAQKMFGAEPGQRPDGTPQAPIQKIVLTLAEDDPGVPWTDEVAEDFAGTTMKRYRVEMDVFYTEGNPNEVLGLQEFYAAPVEIDPGDGSTVTVYRLKYWRDLGKDVVKRAPGSESTSWGEVKSQF